eukprot:TRINITY_DN36891_c0_g1_i1.p1 TRINITY_DN36891_c0_g1~~TRINITY_DN36891_c0_g1_i1.p1  ORF type:complete len:131 (-),score=5.37 TRINITY_DN36891_c0_g1_i1:28-393(-)
MQKERRKKETKREWQGHCLNFLFFLFSSSKSTSQCQHQVKYGSCGDIVFDCSLLIGHLSTTENQSLLCRRDPFLLLNSFLNPLNLAVRLDVKLNLLPSQRFHFDHHFLKIFFSKVLFSECQ